MYQILHYDVVMGIYSPTQHELLINYVDSDFFQAELMITI